MNFQSVGVDYVFVWAVNPFALENMELGPTCICGGGTVVPMAGHVGAPIHAFFIGAPCAIVPDWVCGRNLMRVQTDEVFIVL